MKAHLIISENKKNTNKVLDILLKRLAKNSKRFRNSPNCVILPNHYEFENWDQIFFNGKELIQVLYDFPADVVTALKPIRKPRIIFTDKDFTSSIHGGRYFDFQVFKLPKNANDKACYALASHIYFRTLLHFVHECNWKDQHKATLLNYYRKHAVLNQDKFIACVEGQKTVSNEQ